MNDNKRGLIYSLLGHFLLLALLAFNGFHTRGGSGGEQLETKSGGKKEL